MPRPLVIVTEDLDPAALEWLRARCDVVEAATPDDGALSRSDAIVVRTYTRVDAALLARAPRLRVVGRAGVGLDNIDAEACRVRGVCVVHTPDANTQAVGEYVLALLLDAVRPRADVSRALGVEEWKRLRRMQVAPRQLSGMRLGILGLGRVGTRVARIARGVGMDVTYNDVVEIPPDQREGARPVGLDEVLRESDVLSLHVDARATNRGFINAARLTLMKSDVILINTSRGMVVHAPALGAFLRSRPQARAILDVHEPEPFGTDYPLLGLHNARLLPHLGAATRDAHAAMSWVVRDVWRALEGERAENRE